MLFQSYPPQCELRKILVTKHNNFPKGPGIKKQAEFITNVSSCYASGKPGIKQAQAKYAKILFRKNDINRTLTSDLLSINQSEIK